MEPSRSGNAQSRLACLTAVLFGFTLLWQPIIAVAADATVGGESALPVIHEPEPPSPGSSVIRGTRPAASQTVDQNSGGGNVPPATTGFPIGPYTGGFGPALTGSGWDSTYDYGGLTTPTTPR